MFIISMVTKICYCLSKATLFEVMLNKDCLYFTEVKLLHILVFNLNHKSNLFLCRETNSWNTSPTVSEPLLLSNIIIYYVSSSEPFQFLWSQATAMQRKFCPFCCSSCSTW